MIIANPNLVSFPCKPEDVTNVVTETSYSNYGMIRYATVCIVAGDNTRIPVVCFRLTYADLLSDIFDFSKKLRAVAEEDVARRHRVLGR